MKLQEDSATLEFLAKELLNYFIKPASGQLALQNLIDTLQKISDDLSDYYFFTLPYQVLSGNAKHAEDLSKFKGEIKNITDSRPWNVELATVVVQALYKFINKSDWSYGAVNNNLIADLCIKMQATLQTSPAMSKKNLQELLQGKNGKTFAAELENAWGKIKARHEQIKTAVKLAELANERENTLSKEVATESEDENESMDAANIMADTIKTKPPGFFFWSTFLTNIKANMKEPIAEESEEEYDDEEETVNHSYHSLLAD